MADGHRRPGHRGRGRAGDSPPPPGERILVLPGDEIPGSGLRPGPGTYRTHGKVYASILGLLSRRPHEARVIPLAGRYAPRAGDTVLGTVTDVQGTFWLLDIAAPRWAPLHMSGTPFDGEIGALDGFLRIGDAVVVAVEQIEESGRIGVTMMGESLGKLSGGTIFTVSPAKVPRVIGRSGSMIRTLTELTGCRLVVGQNGRIWADGPAEGLARVHDALELIEAEGHRPGLTERVHGFLASTGPRDRNTGAEAEGGPHSPDIADRSTPPPEGPDEPEGEGDGTFMDTEDRWET